MKFIKGLIVGTAISAGAWMIFSETTKSGKNKMSSKDFINGLKI